MLSIVMLHYGDEQIPLTLQAIERVKQSSKGPYELLAWTNGDSGKHLCDDNDWPDHISAIATTQRQSLAMAYNEAVAFTHGDTICVLHNDCFVHSGWDTAMLERLTDNNIVFPVVHTNKVIAEARGVPLVADWIPPSCCFMLKRELLDKLGGWDEQFGFCHFEDMDLFQRAVDMGAELVRSSAEVTHIRGATRAVEADAANEAHAINELKYAKKHGTKDGPKYTYPLPQLGPVSDPAKSEARI